MNGQLLQLERENAKLQAKIELLEARLQQQP
jgi:BMFP domain-containing protein YqiC